MQEKLSFFDTLMVYGAAGLAWFSGESGRVFIAAGVGGLVRWLSAEKRRIRDGILSIFVGMATGVYAWPLVLVLPKVVWGREVDHTPNNIAMAAFLVGAFGMSAAKIVIAFIETKSGKKGG